MSLFPDTPTMLLTRIAAQASGEDAAVWSEFFELYTPVMRTFLGLRGIDESAIDDIVQDVLVKLVTILREGRYDKGRSRFRTYLSQLLYNEMVSHYRKVNARPDSNGVPVTDDIGNVQSTAGDSLDLDWARARHDEAVRHVLEKTALSGQTKRIFRELEKTGDTCEAVAARNGLSAASVRQIKSRVGRMVAALERRLTG